MGLGVSWCRCPDSPLGFYLVSEHLPLPLLPLWGSAPLTGASACLSSLLVYSWGWVGGVPCYVTWFSPIFLLFLGACSLRSLPCCRLPWGFSGHRVSVLQLPWWRGLGLQPFPSFSGLLLLRLLAGGRWGFAPCVRVLQLRWCLLGLQVRSPCCPSLTLG